VESVSARLETVLTRLSSHFRSTAESRLLGRLPDGRSRAAAGHELAGLLALAAQGVEDRARHAPPAWRALPFEGPFVVGDQIGVTGHDLLVACVCAGAGAGVAAENVAGDAVVEVWAPVTATAPATGPMAEVADGSGARYERVGIEELLRRVLAAAEGLAAVL
jgi:hypothetical protein